MTTDPLSNTYLQQNPAPYPETGQDQITKVRALVDEILAEFTRVLPSNYVSQVPGPFYNLQFQAAAERLATFQLTAQEVFRDADYDFTRPEFLWEILGALIFPAAGINNGQPSINGDITYRDFLSRMVLLLLQGATPETVQEGVSLLDGSVIVTIVERFLGTRKPGSGWGPDDAFTFDVDVEAGGGTRFPTDPFLFQANITKVLTALKPAHAVYDVRNIFRDTFGPLFSDTATWSLTQYHYDDFRRYWLGTRSIVGTAGAILTDRTLFSEPTRSFASVRAGGTLVLTTGLNAGAYTVVSLLSFIYGTDTVQRAYTTAPSGLSGNCTVTSSNTLTDSSQNFGLAVEDEIITILAGPNAGSYRLDRLLGPNGGPVGTVGPAISVRISPSTLRLARRAFQAGTGISYEVDVDRLGMTIPQSVLGEDASEQFIL